MVHVKTESSDNSSEAPAASTAPRQEINISWVGVHVAFTQDRRL